MDGQKNGKIVWSILFGVFVLLLGIILHHTFFKTNSLSQEYTNQMRIKALSVYIFQPWIDIPYQKDVTNQNDIEEIMDSLGTITRDGTEKDDTIYYGAWQLMFICQNDDDSISPIYMTVLGGEEGEVLVGHKPDELYHGTFPQVDTIWETIHTPAKEISWEEWAEARCEVIF